MQCAMMNRRTLAMNWDGLREDEDDDHFYEPTTRASAAIPLDLISSGSDDEGFEDSRMSFVSTASSALSTASSCPYEPPKPPSAMANYDMWMSEPGDIKERRRRLLHGMGLGSTKDMLKVASKKIARAVSRKHEEGINGVDAPVVVKPAESKPKPDSKPPPVVVKDSSASAQSLTPHSPLPRVHVLVRSRSDGDIEVSSATTKERKEQLIGPVPKQKLTKTLSGVCQNTSAVTIVQKSAKRGLSKPNSDVLQSVVADEGLDSFFLIKNLDTGKEFIVKEYNDKGMWNKVSEVQTGKQLTMDEFEKSVGYSPAVKELMRRKKGTGENNSLGDKKLLNNNSFFNKKFRTSKKKGAAILKNIKGVASSKSLSLKEQDQSTFEEPKAPPKAPSQWVKSHQNGKSYKEFTALHMSQEIQAHEGSIWTVRFSFDTRLLASAGEDKVIHVWEVQECDVTSTKPNDESSISGGTAVHPMAGVATDRSPLAELRKGKSSKKKWNSMPDYVDVPETVFALSEKPVCTFKGHEDEVLDLAWSRSQLLLSSSMDKSVRMWDLETKSCMKVFAHNDYVTCIHVNPVDDDYFISGSLDAKVRIWSIPDRQVVDWTDAHEMVTAASYTPDGQGAVIGSHQGICRFYNIDGCKLEHTLDIEMKTKAQGKKLPGFQSPVQVKKVTGFQFTPWNPSEVLITSTDSRIRIYNGPQITQKYRGFRNTSSQTSASFSPDGRYIICASEDSQVYIWKVAESKNPGGGKKKNKVTVLAHEYFQCKDVTTAIPWPGSLKSEAPMVELHSKRHSKRSNAPTPTSPTLEDNVVGSSSRRNLPPLPKKNIGLDRNDSCADEDFSNSAQIDPGIGATNSFRSSSGSISYRESPSISASSKSRSFSENGSQTVQASAWGMVIIAASLEGEIRVYQNFGLPRKLINLFREKI